MVKSNPNGALLVHSEMAVSDGFHPGEIALRDFTEQAGQVFVIR
jgi:hypothetical protein